MVLGTLFSKTVSVPLERAEAEGLVAFDLVQDPTVVEALSRQVTPGFEPAVVLGGSLGGFAHMHMVFQCIFSSKRETFLSSCP